MDQKLQILLDTVRKLIRRGAFPNLSKVLAKSHPADIAHLFRYLELKDQRILFNLIENPEIAASVLAEIEHSTGAQLLEQIAQGKDHRSAAGDAVRRCRRYHPQHA